MPAPRPRTGFVLVDPKKIPSSKLSSAASIGGAFRYGNEIGLDDLPRLPTGPRQPQEGLPSTFAAQLDRRNQEEGTKMRNTGPILVMAVASLALVGYGTLIPESMRAQAGPPLDCGAILTLDKITVVNDTDPAPVVDNWQYEISGRMNKAFFLDVHGAFMGDTGQVVEFVPPQVLFAGIVGKKQMPVLIQILMLPRELDPLGLPKTDRLPDGEVAQFQTMVTCPQTGELVTPLTVMVTVPEVNRPTDPPDGETSGNLSFNFTSTLNPSTATQTRLRVPYPR